MRLPTWVPLSGIEASHADQGGDSAPVQRAKFRKLSQERGAGHGANTRYALQQVGFRFPFGIALQQFSETALQCLRFLLEPVQMLAYLLADLRRCWSSAGCVQR